MKLENVEGLRSLNDGEILEAVMGNQNSAHIVLDRPRCEGHGLCEEAAPHLMHLDDEGELVIDVPMVGEEDLAAAREAVRVCPVTALKLD